MCSILPDSFCCCINPKIGGIILGYIGVNLGIVALVGGLLKWDTSYYWFDMAEHRIDLIPIGAITLIVYAMFLYSVFKEMWLFMVPALIWHSIGVLIATFVAFICFIYWFYIIVGKSFSPEQLPFMLFVLLFTATIWYFMIFSFSLLIKIRNKNVNFHGVVYHTTGSQPNLNQIEVEIARDLAHDVKRVDSA